MSDKKTQLKIHVAKKEQYFARLQRLFDSSRNIEDTKQLSNFRIRFKTLDESRKSLIETVDIINKLSCEIDPEYVPSFQILDVVDEMYCEILSVADEVFSKDKISKKVIKNHPKLPQLELPEFSGDPKEWPIFYECFSNLIHNNDELCDADRIHYLLGKLSGKALTYCSGVPPIGNNYQIVWKTLVEKFQDKRLLASTYLDQMFDFKPLNTDNASNLNIFLEKFDTSVQALRRLNIPDIFDYVITYIALKKLDRDTSRCFENSIRGQTLPSYQEVIDFVKEQARINARIGAVASNKTSIVSNVPLNMSKLKKPSMFQSFALQSSSAHADSVKCVLCKDGHHFISRCAAFIENSPNDRYKIAKQNNLCLNCLGRHTIINCKSKTNCKHCQMRHHTLLHFDSRSNSSKHNNLVSSFTQTSQMQRSPRKQEPVPQSESSSADQIIAVRSGASHPSNSSNNNCFTVAEIKAANQTILLSTAIVFVQDKFGKYRKLRFLLDSCSQAHFITREACKRLGLDILSLNTAVQTIGTHFSKVSGAVKINITSRYDSKTTFSLKALVIAKIGDPLPQCAVELDELDYLLDLPLADDTFYCPGEIDGIIGAEIFPHLLGSARLSGNLDKPTAIETSLGYVVIGNAQVAQPTQDFGNFCLVVEPSLEVLVRKFWEIDDIPSCHFLSPDELECESIYNSTTQRLENGAYVVQLPFKCGTTKLGNSYNNALKRFLSLERKFASYPEFKLEYTNVFEDYLKQGHMEKLSVVDLDEPHYFIPHHGVFKIGSLSTPLRIVLDASCKSDSDFSLNDILHAGPKLQTDVVSLFLNFRLFEYALTSDIRQMYRQIYIAPQHRRFQRVLWRSSPSEPIQVFELITVSFGLKSSPYLALKTIRQLASDEKDHYPLAGKIIARDMYMDDLVTSVSNLEEAKHLYRELVGMLASGGFSLVKWATNDIHLLSDIPSEIRAPDIVNFETDFLKILGLQWHPKLDTLSYHVDEKICSCTKRNILSSIARCFDPLGFLAPVILVAKLFVKELWALHIDWDESPPSKIQDQWSKFQNEYSLLRSLRIPRFVGVHRTSLVSLIGFADACETSYGAVVFLRVETNGMVHTNMICAKSKVVPLRTMSIPRLELCASHVLAKLLNFILIALQDRLKVEKVFAFSDSTVALSWINSPPYRWKTFVANRVSKIQELCPTVLWYHVDGENNISDCLSRGLYPSDFLAKSDWFSGPEWLRFPFMQWPVKLVNGSFFDTKVERKPSVFVNSISDEYFNDNRLYDLINRCSSWWKLLRSTVYVLRFLKLITLKNNFTSDDFEKALLVLVKIVQVFHFSKEMSEMKNGIECSTTLRKLRPFLKDGIIRVGGRLTQADLDFDGQHPILLPKKDPFVNLLIDHYHRTNLHTGPGLTLSLLRQKYWILAARGIVRNRINKCNFCFRSKPKTGFPLMADLPSCRVLQAKPFSHTGVDYAGPISIVYSRYRGCRPQKAYICLFVCLVTKAIHLELVSSLCTPNFIQAFKRFISRRGPCSVIYSDQGSNFVGAKISLELYNLIDSESFKETIGSELSRRGLQWKFNPPAAPHFGGTWESQVKSVKTHLNKIIGHHLLSYEEMTTLLIQIEALMNSRPLCVLCNDPSDPKALTPAHFLTLSPLESLPAENLINQDINRLTRFQLVDSLVQTFWKRWKLEYLTTLQVHDRHNKDFPPIELNTVVVLHQVNTLPLQWPLGIVVAVYPGKDGRVRVVDVKTKTGIYRRPVVKVFPLPTQ